MIAHIEQTKKKQTNCSSKNRIKNTKEHNNKFFFYLAKTKTQMKNQNFVRVCGFNVRAQRTNPHIYY